MKPRSAPRPFPQAMSTQGLGLFKWQRTVTDPGSRFSRQEVHPSGVFAGLASAAPEVALQRGILAQDGWALVRA